MNAEEYEVLSAVPSLPTLKISFPHSLVFSSKTGWCAIDTAASSDYVLSIFASMLQLRKWRSAA
jgi:hypothetical protein